jgi:dTDP-4-amino-4,6-dideoxygalactose transaminase
MEKRSISFSPPDISQSEIDEVVKTLQSGWLTTGPRTKELERKLAQYCHTARFVCLNSATASEELNLRILGIGEGDEVLVPAYTYTATASAAIHAGATVKFIDCQKDSCEMDYDQMEEAITAKTKAVIPVDLGGVVCDYDRIYEAVERKKSLFVPGGNTELGQQIQKTLGRVAVVADCAHALGATRQGKMSGQFADFSSYSFHAVKNLTTIEGGAATWNSIPGIDDEEMYHQYQLYSLHGQSKDALAKTQLGAWEYDIVAPLYKCNMTDVMAAVGLKQLERYPQLLARRQEIIRQYDEACDKLGVKHLIHQGEDFCSSGHLYLARVPWADHDMRCEIITKMAEQGIPCNVHYKPLPMMTAYKNLGWDIKDFPRAYDYYKNEISLPLHTLLTEEDVAYIVENFSRIVESLR